ncbi:PQQ-binding-like beta-propeller repeat protein [Georgenia alba]|uniref:PQQ-binding-like beta-propeller repeat protein n=1 Tax=Georgenia alba TaxID=2233858 RepID=A0ABW2QGH1_9MICO
MGERKGGAARPGRRGTVLGLGLVVVGTVLGAATIWRMWGWGAWLLGIAVAVAGLAVIGLAGRGPRRVVVLAGALALAAAGLLVPRIGHVEPDGFTVGDAERLLDSDGESFVFALGSGQITSRAESGEITWTSEPVVDGGDEVGGMISDDQVLVWGDRDAEDPVLTALAVSTGEVLWRHELYGSVRGSAPDTVTDGVIVLPDDPETIGLARETGTVLWRSPGTVAGRPESYNPGRDWQVGDSDHILVDRAGEDDDPEYAVLRAADGSTVIEGVAGREHDYEFLLGSTIVEADFAEVRGTQATGDRWTVESTHPVPPSSFNQVDGYVRTVDDVGGTVQLVDERGRSMSSAVDGFEFADDPYGRQSAVLLPLEPASAAQQMSGFARGFHDATTTQALDRLLLYDTVHGGLVEIDVPRTVIGTRATGLTWNYVYRDEYRAPADRTIVVWSGHDLVGGEFHAVTVLDGERAMTVDVPFAADGPGEARDFRATAEAVQVGTDVYPVRLG